MSPSPWLSRLCTALLLAGAAAAGAEPQVYQRTPAPQGAHLYFISPTDGATVGSPVIVRFGLTGMGVAPAGIAHEATGHHHLIVDAELPALGESIPNDATHLHFGKGQTETSLTLPPGRHTLQLLLGDHNHVPHDPPVVSERISITVK
jgi:hypothetical protein